MQLVKVLLIVSLIISIYSCSESDNVIAPVVNELPEKLFPYETIYDAATFKQRRNNLMNKIPDNAIVVIATNNTYLRNGDINYDFRPASNYFYLTGFDEPNAIAIIRKRPSEFVSTELIMFVEKREGGLEQWLGSVYGPEGAVEYFGADSAYEFEQFGSYIDSQLESGPYQSVYANFETNQSVADSFYKYVSNNFPVNNVDNFIDTLRVIKTPIEISSIQNAVNVSVQAFTEAIKLIEPGMYEYEVDAFFDYILRLNGCSWTAFPTIVASGPNINVLHYQANQRQMEDGDLVMIDYGAEYGYYASDITRTIPVNGTFSTEQAAVYEIVLEAHKAAINAAAPGVNFDDLYYLARDIILDGLLAKGIITGNKNDIIESYTYRQYIPAGLGPPVGLDAHDPFPRDENGKRYLRENMVMAFEPHIYLYEGDQTVDPKYWNVCARIEDVVLITASGSEILSKDLPNELSEIEALMQ